MSENSNVIDSIEFYEEIGNILIEVRNELGVERFQKYYSNNELWTGTINRVYEELHKKLSEQIDDLNLYSKRSMSIESEMGNIECFRTHPEFSYIDASFWVENQTLDLEEFPFLINKGFRFLNDENRSIWKPLVAIEHENDSTGCLFELKQLLFINAPLKILISYIAKPIGDIDDRDSRSFLDNLHRIVSILEENMKMNDGDRLIIMLGSKITKSDCKSDNYKSNISFDGFLFKKDSSVLSSETLNTIVL